MQNKTFYKYKVITDHIFHSILILYNYKFSNSSLLACFISFPVQSTVRTMDQKMDQKIPEATTSEEKPDQIIGYIHNVSPIKEGKFFDFQVQSKEKYLRGVCFAPAKRDLFQSVQDGSSPVKIKRFRIDQKSNTEDLLMGDNVEVQQLPTAPFPKVDIPSTFDLAMLKTIAPGQLITVKAKVTALREAKTLQTSRGTLKMMEGQIVDPQGYSKIVFWEKFCDQVEEGTTYIFENIRVKKDSVTKQVYVNTAKSGTTITATEPHANILALAPTFTVSDDSMTFSVEGRVVGVLSTSMYIHVACNKCNKKIQNDDNSSDLITCNYCNMQQMADLCPTQYYAQLLFLTTTKKDKLTLTLFNKVTSQLFSTGVFNPSKNDFVKVLLGLKDVVVTYNKRSKVVTNILRPHI